MKRYTLIDNKTGKKYEYSNFMWNLAWTLQYLFGAIFGMIILSGIL